MTTNNLIWPAPDGQLAIVCCSPDNFYTDKEGEEPKTFLNYATITLEEQNLNAYNEGAFKSALDCGFNVFMYPGSDLQTKWESQMR